MARLPLPRVQRAATIDVTVQTDTDVELDETFLVNLSSISAGGRDVTFADSQGQGTVTNDDSAQLSINDVSQAEGDSGTTAYTFTISLDEAVDTDVSVDWATAFGTASAADFTAQSGTATITAGSTSTTVTVNIDGETLLEGDETFTVNLSSLVNGGRSVTISDAMGAGTITNDDFAPVATDDAYATNEDTALNIPASGVLGNDSDIDGDTITVLSHTAAANGTVVVNGDGSFTYTPNANFNGSRYLHLYRLRRQRRHRYSNRHHHR